MFSDSFILLLSKLRNVLKHLCFKIHTRGSFSCSTLSQYLFFNLTATLGEVSLHLGCQIGESLFTLFASLTYAYHCLMTLIK